ncbi:hypothetical protein GGI15_003079 [Coemansia interrupta]|uniref:Uncharacterized protein n=1 Tax=Coemansia interrupta TaxID=1126814 RepID=A0A9W8HAD9_9FUNG|nr:hypothetical protein GGI15_003079 [Coemansia interrupta]
MLTSCELGIIDSRAAYVSADCLESRSTDANTDSFYEVVVNFRTNNIAVIQFNLYGQTVETSPIGVLRELLWEDLVFVRRSVSISGENLSWGQPQVVVAKDGNSNNTTCKTMSPVYATNSYDFACTELIAASPSEQLSMCDVPYGSVYTHINGQLYFVGLFSHLSVSGNSSSLCSNSTRRSYFTLVSNFVFFAAAQTQRAIDFYPANSTVFPTLNASYSMQNPSSPDPKDIRTVAGNIYSARLQPGKTLGSDKTSVSETGLESAKDGGSGRQTVVAGICGAIGGMVLLCLVLFLVHRFRARRKPRTVDPYAQSAIEEMLAPTTGNSQWMRPESKIRLANILRYSFRLSQSSIDPTSDIISSYTNRDMGTEGSR